MSNLVAALGIEPKDINKSRTYLAAYQFIMRTALRVQDNQETVEVFVADLSTASFLQGLFPGATLEKHDVKLQLEPLEDGRESNGGARQGSGRKPKFPSDWSDSKKTTYRRYKNKQEAAGQTVLKPSEWSESPPEK